MKIYASAAAKYELSRRGMCDAAAAKRDYEPALPLLKQRAERLEFCFAECCLATGEYLRNALPAACHYLSVKVYEITAQACRQGLPDSGFPAAHKTCESYRLVL